MMSTCHLLESLLSEALKTCFFILNRVLLALFGLASKYEELASC